jgi:hypothetical protein
VVSSRKPVYLFVFKILEKSSAATACLDVANMLQIFGFRKWKKYGQDMDDDNCLLVYFLFKL